MAKAARKLGITQPAVTQAIADLEATFGARLFDRRPGGVTSTLFGDAIIRHANAILDELRQVDAEIASLADPKSGRLRIACPEFIAAGVLPAALQSYSREFPRVIIDVVQAENISADFRLLRQREVDLMIGRISARNVGPDVDIEILYSERMFVVTGPNSKWTRLRNLSLAQLANGQWILPPSDSLPGALAREVFLAQGVDPPAATINSYSIHVRTAMAAHANFLTILHASILKFSPKRFGIRTLPLELKGNEQLVGVATLSNRTLPPSANSFLQSLRNVAKLVA